jgi:hypothetical protein
MRKIGTRHRKQTARISRRVKLGIAALVVMLVAVGAAIAYWTAGGTGTGSASATTSSALTVNQTNSPITNLYPGGPAQPLSGNFDNPNAGNAYVHSVTASIHPFSSQTDPSQPACTQADFSIGGSATVNAEIPAGNGVGSWSGLNVSMVDNPGANQDNCKGISIQIDYTAQAS